MGRKHGCNTVGDDGRHDGPVPHPRVDPDLLPPPLHTGAGPILGGTYLTATPASLRWGRLPTSDTAPVATIRPGSTITIDTVSHEGLLGDQGADPVAFFGRWGVPAAAVTPEILDQVMGAALSEADGSFNTILELGFRSAIEKEWRWRLSRGESTANLAAFEHLRPDDV